MRKSWQFILIILSVIALVAFGIRLEDNLGFPFDTTYRLACAGICLAFTFKFKPDHSSTRWFHIAFAIALLINVAMFFTPLVNRPASRGEILLFALPTAIVMLTAQTFNYTVTNEHERAVRQQLALALILAIMFCGIIFSLLLISTPISHSS